MIVVIPMAGLSRRFTEAGYNVPKYMLKAGNISLFRHSVLSFEALFGQARFLFVHRDVHGTGEFIDRECAAMGLVGAARVNLDLPTRGQAETVAIGLQQAGAEGSEPILIFNIDTIRSGYRIPSVAAAVDGYLEVFRGEGDGWSFVSPIEEPGQRVAMTTEKRRISELCSTGLYYFRRSNDFLHAFEEELSTGPTDANEFYVAPLYNRLIRRGLDVRYEIIEPDEVIFSGVPAEYEAFRARTEKRAHVSHAEQIGGK